MSFHFELQNDMFSLDDINTFDDNFSAIIDDQSEEQVQLYEGEDYWGNFDSLHSNYGFFQDDHQNFLGDQDQSHFSKYQSQNQQQILDDVGMVDSWSASLETSLQEINKVINSEVPNHMNIKDVEANNNKGLLDRSSLASLELLNNYGRGFNRLKGESVIHDHQLNSSTQAIINDHHQHQKLSTEEIFRIAGARFVKSSSTNPSHPSEWSFLGISIEETKDVELVEILLSCAEKVGFRNYESAERLLNLCESLASKIGNPVQRVVYYFYEALREKINRETGRSFGLEGSKTSETLEINKTIIKPDAPRLAVHQCLPCIQALKLVAVQTIVEHVAQAKNIHIVDLRLGFGIQWTILIQTLASSHKKTLIELLKITALGTTDTKTAIEETGKRLSNFACSMRIPFHFNVVCEMNSLQENINNNANETIVVYTSYGLSHMISNPSRELERLMKAIRGLKPSIMVVNEVESSQNSSVFFTRFIETLFYHATLFDCIAMAMSHDETNRAVFESLYSGAAIKNVIATEGEERKVRSVSVRVWREFFERFGMEEIELSEMAIAKAKIVAMEFICGSFCTFGLNGKCLLMGWKGTPLHSVSAWKFNVY